MRLILILLLLCTNAYSQESGNDYIPDFTENSSVTLNEQLRRTSRRLRNLEDGININNDTSGVLSLSRGGTGQDLSSSTADTMIYFGNSSTIYFTAASTRSATNYLRDDFTWAGIDRPIGLEFIESATFSSTSTVTITETISSDEIIKIIIEGTSLGADPFFRINSDSGAKYKYGNFYNYLSPGNWLDVSDAQFSSSLTEVRLTDNTNSVGGDEYRIEINVKTDGTSSYFDWEFSSAGGSTGAQGRGVGDASNLVMTSLNFDNDSTNSTGRYYVYKMASATYTD